MDFFFNINLNKIYYYSLNKIYFPKFTHTLITKKAVFMTVIIATKTKQKHFKKNYIKIGSSANNDLSYDIGSDYLITLQYSDEKKAFILSSVVNQNVFTIGGKPLPKRGLIKTGVKISVTNSDDFFDIKIIEDDEKLPEITEKTYSAAEKEGINLSVTGKVTINTPQFAIHNTSTQDNINEATNELKTIIEEDTTAHKTPSEQNKLNIEKARTTVIKEVGFIVNDLKKRLQINSLTSKILHFAMLMISFVTAFGVANFLTGLKIEQVSNYINLPMNIKITLLFTGVIYGMCLILKQGVYHWYENNVRPNNTAKITQPLMLTVSVLCFSAFYIINLLYYAQINPVFGVLISLFFVGLNAVLAAANGYFKFTLHLISYELDKYEYREDFEAIMTDYRFWIEQFINKISKGKIEKIKDRLFSLQIKSVGELLLGILTAPFLAYGVSNTLATCFPEAAGWIRVSGLRFSPIFLILASFMIVFAFFAFVNAFLAIRKTQASDIIKQDGFSNYLTHGVEVFGIQAVQNLATEKSRSLKIALAIVFIEFTMNTSYFFTEIGGDLQGILLSIIAALVPTALLIAETYMLSQTKFDIYACESVLDKREG